MTDKQAQEFVNLLFHWYFKWPFPNVKVFFDTTAKWFLPGSNLEPLTPAWMIEFTRKYKVVLPPDFPQNLLSPLWE